MQYLGVPAMAMWPNIIVVYGKARCRDIPHITPYCDKATDPYYFVLCDQVAARNVMLSQVFLTPCVV